MQRHLKRISRRIDRLNLLIILAIFLMLANLSALTFAEVGDYMLQKQTREEGTFADTYSNVERRESIDEVVSRLELVLETARAHDFGDCETITESWVEFGVAQAEGTVLVKSYKGLYDTHIAENMIDAINRINTAYFRLLYACNDR